MPASVITDALLRSLKPTETRRTIYEKDRRYSGFLVEVMPSGRVSFRYRYSFEGRRKKAFLGYYPAMSLADARARYRQLANMVLAGASPVEALKTSGAAQVASLTFEELTAEWVKNSLRPANKNARQDETYLRRDILPLLGKRPPSEIQRIDLWACIEPVRQRGTYQAARRVQSVLKRVFAFAVDRGYLSTDPAAGMKPSAVAKAHARDRVLRHEELPIWLHAIETSGISTPIKLALRLLLLIPVRKGELLSARWEHIDLGASTWDIPKEASKNGAPIRHLLSSQCVEIFRRLKQLAAGSPWVLPSSRGYGRHPLSKSTLNKSLAGIEGLPAGIVIHDLRRTVRTNLTELGVEPHVAELCLNHRPTGTAKVYDRAELLEARHEALLRWERFLEALLTKQTTEMPPAASPDAAELIEKLRSDDALRRYVIQQIFGSA